MNLRLNLQFLLLFGMLAVNAQAQSAPSLNIGDPAPRLQVRAWLKGTPVERFQKGKVYVVEFWATWCGSCIEAMPHLSTLAAQYRDRVTFLGIDILEKKTTSIEKVKAFVERMGSRMDYNVAADDSNFMQTGWLNASGEEGIPHAYVVDEEGKLAWMGYPWELDEVLAGIVNHRWDLNEALVRKKEQQRLESLDRAAMDTLNVYAATPGKEDSILIVIQQIVQKEPKLTYAPIIASFTFSSLLKTDPQKAYEYGKKVLVTPAYDGDPAFYSIFGVIDSYWYAGKFNLPKEIYALAAEACQAEIDQYPWHSKSHYFYHKLADWYYRAGEKAKAIATEQKAIEELKSNKNAKPVDLTAYQSRLQQYRNM